MTPLERAARAPYKQIGSDFDPFGEGEDAKWPEFVEEARAVIEAIREPSDDMLTAGIRSLPWGHSDPEGSKMELTDAWRLMVDKLLAEGA